MSLADGIADDVRNRFGESISPLTARTMQLMVGDKSLQFVFVASPTTTGAVTHNVTWDESRGILHADSGYLRHMTIGITSLSGEHKPSEYKTWALPAYDYAVRTDQKTVHLYAKVERNGSKGMFVASDTAKAMEEEAGYYYLYLGMLSSAPDRVFTPLYGFTEVLPGQVRTERIVSTDGSTSIDLRTGEIVSKKITFVYPDGSQHPYPDSYLHKAIKEGSTEIQGGLVLGSVIGAKDTSGAVTSYLSGLSSLPAFSAGVTNFGKPSEKRVVEINHDGTGHWGLMTVEDQGRVVKIGSMQFGGNISPYFNQDARALLYDDPRGKSAKVYIGEQGAAFAFSIGAMQGFVRVCNTETRCALQVKGTTDLPGVLLAGNCWVSDRNGGSGKPEGLWGAKAGSFDVKWEYRGNGHFFVRHGIGHTRYSVQLTPLWKDGWENSSSYTLRVQDMTADSFIVRCTHSKGGYSFTESPYIAFSFLIIGDNY